MNELIIVRLQEGTRSATQVDYNRARDDFIKLELEELVKKYVAELQLEMTELIHPNTQTS